MKDHLFLMDSLTDVDDDLIAQADSIRPKRRWPAWVAAAAAVAILIGAGLLPRMSTNSLDPTSVLQGQENTTPTPPSHPTPTVSTPPEDPHTPKPPFITPPDKIISMHMPGFGQGIVGTLSSVDNVSSSSSADIRQSHICITAKAVEILPDTYYMVDQSQYKFRLVRMNVIRTVAGTCLVDNFYYILPEAYVTDLTRYDALVIPLIEQFGHINFVLYNDTAKQLEAMDLVVLGFYPYLVSKIAAFTNGQLDTSLWTSTDAWIENSTLYEFAPEDPSLAAYENRMRDFYGPGADIYKDTILPAITAQNSQVADALAYVKPFENGVYIPQIMEITHDWVFYRRYINGYPTTENIGISPNKASIGHRFTDEEVQKLPDLSVGLQKLNDAYDAGALTPPHLKNWENMRFIRHVIYGWYTKSENGVYGVIRVSWMYADDTKKYQDDWFYYDDQYYIYDEEAGNFISIEYEDLTTILGENPAFVAKADKYDDTGRVYDPPYEIPYA